MNEEVAAIFEQGRLLLVQHAPADILKDAVPAGLLFLITGIGLSVLGSKLSRFALTSAWVVLGGMGGVEFATLSDFPTILCALGGAAVFGILGYHSYRLWAGILAGAVLASIALGVFSYRNVAPHVREFERQSLTVRAESPPTFALLSPEEQRSYNDRSPRDWFGEFYAYVANADAQTDRSGRALGLAVLAIGACLGVLAVRWATILSTSLVGTAFVTAGMAALLSRIAPDRSYQAFQSHSDLFAVAIGGFFLTSLVLQTLLTRSGRSPHGEKAAS